jgi:hypothetical protein
VSSVPPPPDLSDLSPLLQLILLLFVILAVGSRAKRRGNLRLAAPTLVPLTTDEASRFASDFGTAYAELMGAEPPDREI